jgi:hypothetical protein
MAKKPAKSPPKASPAKGGGPERTTIVFSPEDRAMVEELRARHAIGGRPASLRSIIVEALRRMHASGS